MVTEDRLLNRLRAVEDPAFGVDVVSLGLVTDVSIDDGEAAVSVAFDAPRSPAEWTMCDEIRALCRGLGLDPRIYADPVSERPPVPGARNVLAIATDEPAAGASLVTANLAAALASIGARVGVLDVGIGVAGRDRSNGIHGDPRGSWLDAVDPPALSRESIQPPRWRGVAVARLDSTCAAIDEAADGDLLELVVPTLVEALEWGRLDYLLVTLPLGTDGPTERLLAELSPTGALVVASADTDPAGVGDTIAALRVRETRVLGAVGTVGGPDAVDERWRVHELEPGCPVLGPVPLDRCTLPVAPDADAPPGYPGRATEASPYDDLALSVADQIGAANRRAVVERRMA